MKPPRVALATCAEHARLAPDDVHLAAALGAHGIEAVPVVWNAPGTDWGGFDGCVVRSVWDYHLEPQRFLAWTRLVASATRLWNPPELIAWNADKSYLRGLAARGVPTIPTRWLGRGTEVDLAGLLAEEGWEEAILKPTVDLGAKNLLRVRAGDSGAQARLDALLARHEVMAQPFVPSLQARGELSLVYRGGELSHAVRKLPAPGDFRVQSLWGGTSRAVAVVAAELEIAADALAGLDPTPLYARVDLVEGPDRERLLIELELIDPNLYLAECPGAAGALAGAIAAALSP